MTCSVLVVEDDAVLRKGIVALLQLHGHQASGAAGVAEAVSQLDLVAPTHVLLDLNLPDGTGNDVLRRIPARAGLRVAIVSGSSDAALGDEARALGVEAFFRKPPDWDKLLEWVVRS